MEWLQPKFTVAPSALTYSRLLLKWARQRRFNSNLRTSEPWRVKPGGRSKRSLKRAKGHSFSAEMSAEAGALGLVALDWKPAEAGYQWVEATLDNGMVVSGPTIMVRTAKTLPSRRRSSAT